MKIERDLFSFRSIIQGSMEKVSALFDILALQVTERPRLRGVFTITLEKAKP